nr:hypothetical protein DID78_06915 [Candidatus Marinamargulisbacteria bacterium SCGC AG-343-D04]
MYTFIIIHPFKIDTNSLSRQHPNTRWVHYYDCEEGIAALCLFHKKIHGLFVSYSMTFLNGLQVHLLIKKQFKQLPVIIIYTCNAINEFLNQQFTHNYIASYADFLMLKTFFKILKIPI